MYICRFYAAEVIVALEYLHCQGSNCNYHTCVLTSILDMQVCGTTLSKFMKLCWAVSALHSKQKLIYNPSS